MHLPTHAPARRVLSRTPAAVAGVCIALFACSPATSAGNGRATTADTSAVNAVRRAAVPITGAADDYAGLLALAGGARLVLLGEQTHGTHEFYRERARITQRLIMEHGFRAIALEADWPDVARVNRYIHGTGTDATAEAALADFTRFPRWMWRNADTRDLVRWLREYNMAQPAERRVSIFGLDVYSLFGSIDAVVAYLAEADPAAAARARQHYACFEEYRPNAHMYGAAARAAASCQRQAATVLAEMRSLAATRPADPAAAALLYSALRNATSVVNAEEYFRTLYTGGISTWNLRDQRMAEAVESIEAEMATPAGPAKIVIWAHNTHTGDARVTDPGEAGEHNIGQLSRQRLGTQALLVGFFTYRGTVMAASEWDRPGRVFTLRDALPESYSALMHAAGIPAFWLDLRRDDAVREVLASERLQRAVGVVYAPATERQSHYFRARLASQFDAAIFFDVTSAVTPLP